MDDEQRIQDALVIAGIGIVVLVVVRVALTWLLGRLATRLAKRPGIDGQRVRTQVFLARRLAMMLIVVVVVWNVLDQFPATRIVAQTLLASSAVIALFVGLAVQTPLSNLGSGLLLALTQPVRLGDRATVDDQTGTVEEITSIHTVLRTDDDRRIFIPNERMISVPIINRTIVDPRRAIHVRIPARLQAPPVEVLAAVETAALDAIGPGCELSVLCAEVDATAMWLEVEGLIDASASVRKASSAVRTAALDALGAAGWLPPEVA